MDARTKASLKRDVNEITHGRIELIDRVILTTIKRGTKSGHGISEQKLQVQVTAKLRSSVYVLDSAYESWMPANVSEGTFQLKEMGFVSKKGNSENGRTFKLTKKGRKALKRARRKADLIV